MKAMKCLIFLMIIFAVVSSPCIAAPLHTGLETEAVPFDEFAEIANNREFAKITEETALPARCFDVREDGAIVVGSKSANTAYLSVYDAAGIFQYGFETEELGSCRVMWGENSIIYYSIRGGRLYEVDSDGKIIKVENVISSTENSVYDQKVLTSTTRTVGESTYRMTNGNRFVDAFSASFAKIVKEDTNGKVIAYNASDGQLMRTVWGLASVVVLLAFIAICIIVNAKKHFKK